MKTWGISEAEWTLHGLISFEDIFGALRVLHHQRAHIQLKKILARISRLCLRKHYPRRGKARLTIFSRDNKMPLKINMHKIQHIEGIWGRFGGISEILLYLLHTATLSTDREKLMMERNAWQC